MHRSSTWLAWLEGDHSLHLELEPLCQGNNPREPPLDKPHQWGKRKEDTAGGVCRYAGGCQPCTDPKTHLSLGAHGRDRPRKRINSEPKQRWTELPVTRVPRCQDGDLPDELTKGPF